MPELQECHRRHKEATIKEIEAPAPVKYRKKPILVDGWEWNPLKGKDLPFVKRLSELEAGHPAFKIMEDMMEGKLYDSQSFGWIETLEGGHIVSLNDYIIRGVQGEYYPIKPDIFAATYITEEEYQKQFEEERTKKAAEEARAKAPEILNDGTCLFVLAPEVCPEELGYLSPGQYAELRIRGFMSKKGFEVDSVEHSR